MENEFAQTSRRGYEHGLVAGADTAQLDSELSNARAEVTRLQAALRTAKRSLLVLIGRPNSPTDDLVIEARLDTPPPIPLATPGISLGRAHVCTPVTNAHLVCRLLLEKKKQINKP